jgi:uncharacterized protein (DUF952 family)
VVDVDPQQSAVSRNGQLFPHLYGALTMDVVLAYGPLTRNSDGTVRLPA